MCTGRSTFSRTHAFALGTVQIMIGVMVSLFGVVLFIQVGMTVADSLTAFSGFFVWGAAIFITAGSLTVAAGKSSNRCLMNTTLAFNVIATVAACAATIFFTFGAVVVALFCGGGGLSSSGCFDDKVGLGIFLLLILFLEFIISIVISVFVCKSTCDCCNQPSEYNVPGDCSVDLQASPSYSAPATVVQLPLQMKNDFNPADGQSSLGLMDPPPYSEA